MESLPRLSWDALGATSGHDRASYRTRGDTLDEMMLTALDDSGADRSPAIGVLVCHTY